MQIKQKYILYAFKHVNYFHYGELNELNTHLFAKFLCLSRALRLKYSLERNEMGFSAINLII